MPTFTYLGFSDEEKKARLEKLCEKLDPPEKRGKDPIYHITREDGEALREEKKKLFKQWVNKQRAEIAKGLDAEQQRMSFMVPGPMGKLDPVVFEKGKPVELEEDHVLVPKLTALSVGVKPEKLHPQHVVVKTELFKMGKPAVAKAEPKA